MRRGSFPRRFRVSLIRRRRAGAVQQYEGEQSGAQQSSEYQINQKGYYSLLLKLSTRC